MRNCTAMSLWRLPGSEKSTPAERKLGAQHGLSVQPGGHNLHGQRVRVAASAHRRVAYPSQRLGVISAEVLHPCAGHALVVVVRPLELVQPLRIHPCGLSHWGVDHGVVGQRDQRGCVAQTGLVRPAAQRQPGHKPGFGQVVVHSRREAAAVVVRFKRWPLDRKWPGDADVALGQQQVHHGGQGQQKPPQTICGSLHEGVLQSVQAQLSRCAGPHTPNADNAPIGKPGLAAHVQSFARIDQPQRSPSGTQAMVDQWDVGAVRKNQPQEPIDKLQMASIKQMLRVLSVAVKSAELSR